VCLQSTAVIARSSGIPSLSVKIHGKPCVKASGYFNETKQAPFRHRLRVPQCEGVRLVREKPLSLGDLICRVFVRSGDGMKSRLPLYACLRVASTKLRGAREAADLGIGACDRCPTRIEDRDRECGRVGSQNQCQPRHSLRIAKACAVWYSGMWRWIRYDSQVTMALSRR